jgi:hypothetical protein
LWLHPGWLKIRIRDRHPGSATLGYIQYCNIANILVFAGSYIIMYVDLKTSTLEGLTDVYQRDKDIIQQNIFNKTEESLGKSHLS